MVIAKIDPQEARGLVCAQGGDEKSFCAGPFWQVRLAHQAGPIVTCETHLFRLGRGIADALKEGRTLSEFPAESEKKIGDTLEDGDKLKGTPFTWG